MERIFEFDGVLDGSDLTADYGHENGDATRYVTVIDGRGATNPITISLTSDDESYPAETRHATFKRLMSKRLRIVVELVE